MIWLGADIDGPIVVTRTIHFAASAMTAGALIFRAAVAAPSMGRQCEAAPVVQPQVRKLAWSGLLIAVASGGIWVVLLTQQLSDEGFGEAMMSGAMRDVLMLTQFGIVMQVRLGLAAALALGLVLDRTASGRWLGLGAAVGLMASVAWTGHAASTPHALGYLHLAADALHSCAAAAWIGGLLPLALLLGAGSRRRSAAWAALELEAARRFSMLGIVCVATVAISGLLNAWILVGSWRGLVIDAYGWLLLMKLTLFAGMLALAAVNRMALTPKLALPFDGDAQPTALRRLTRNTVIEVVLGILVFGLVGLLGTLHPAAHLVK